ncbi:MAG: hypothetical protein ABI197_14385 [Granulicella sp.]
MPYDLSFSADADINGILRIDQARIDRLRIKRVQSNIVSIVREVIATQDCGIGFQLKPDVIFEVNRPDEKCKPRLEQYGVTSGFVAPVNGA